MCDEEVLLQRALEHLRGCPPPSVEGFREVVITGSGFCAPLRLAIREFAARAGLTYSGDLVRGTSTHLVRVGGSAAEGGTSKPLKAAEWGVPCVRLSWLLDSVAAGLALPVEPYLLAPGSSSNVGARTSRATGPPETAAEASCWHLEPQRHRPSSVASNAPTAAAADRTPAALQQALGSGSEHQLPAQQHPAQRQQQPGCPEQRPPLAPVANMLADQLRRMSISPEPPAMEALGASAARCPLPQRSPPPPPADSPPLQRSPSLAGSPQRSLSMQGLMGSERGTPAETLNRPALAATAAAASAGRWRAQQQMPVCSASPESFSPMQQSPADGLLLAHEQQQQAHPEQQRRGRSGLPDEGGTVLLPFPLAVGRCTSDDHPAGSPMAESPAVGAAPAAAGAASGTGASGSSAHRPRSRLAGTPSTQGGEEPMCSMPTPACIRDWSDDDSLALSPIPAGDVAMLGTEGVTQTPPEVRQALAAVNAPTQWPPARWERKQQQQEQRDGTEAAATAAAEEAVSLGIPAAAGAVRDWSDDETVASEPPDVADVVIPESKLGRQDGPAGQKDGQRQQDDHHQQHQQRQQEKWDHQQQQEQQAEPAAALLASRQQPQPSTASHEQTQHNAKRSLLRVSRLSAPGSQHAAHTVARSGGAMLRWPGGTAIEAAAATAATAHADAEPLAAGCLDDPVPSPGGGWEAAQPMSSGVSGSGGTSPGASPGSIQHSGQVQQQRGQQQHPAGSSSAGPVRGEHFVTSRRPDHGGAFSTKPQQHNRGLRDWSEDESSGEDFPTPNGQRKYAGGLTGLTQLDRIVIARPKPSASTATWRSGEGASSGGVHGLKFLQRPPRGNAVRQHHALANLKAVQFAEQVQVAAAGGLVLSTKDKKTAVRLQPGGLTEEEAEEDDFRVASSSSSGSQLGGGSGGGSRETEQAQQQQSSEPALAEPQTFYRLQDGTWWLEYCRFYTAAQAEAAAVQAGRALALPAGFDRGCELLKAVSREHAPMRDVAGGVQVRRVKQGSNALRLRGSTGAAGAGRSFYWRLALDTDQWRVVTDQPSADFVAIE